MLENRSPQKIFVTLVSTGILIGMTLDQLLWLVAGKLESPMAASAIPGMLAILLLPIGWRMVASLPWSTINDHARYEYRNPHGPFGGGEKASGSAPSRNPAPEDLGR